MGKNIYGQQINVFFLKKYKFTIVSFMLMMNTFNRLTLMKMYRITTFNCLSTRFG